MTITVKFFATFHDIVGVSELKMNMADAATVGDLIARLEQQYPVFEGKLDKLGLVAINEKYAHRRKELQPNDVVALFPPVSGG
ncbi:molybdopterin converting factor, subunit 1 [Candidatus Vecturithrix granuli]|uniref:Molybdopterin synthase sulfur carrier subunit n=1 Tax=Vecturithrix granuli TaxID=1499967 RepID=A0A081C098_VECG1|nr:molybdopterin converting factor, subunit 1 [Candidatus Vecturithrix granuli]